MNRADRLTHLTMHTTANVFHATFQGFFPFSVYRRSELQISCPFPRTCPVTPLGFLNPSMFCSPNDFPSLFHLGTALGIRSSRLFSSLSAVYLLRLRLPHDVQHANRSRHAASSGLNTLSEARPSRFGYSPLRPALPPRAFSPLRFLALLGRRLALRRFLHDALYDSPLPSCTFPPSSSRSAVRRYFRVSPEKNAASLSRDRRDLLEVSHLVDALHT